MSDRLDRIPSRYLMDMLQTVDAVIEQKSLKQEITDNDRWRIRVLQEFAGRIMDTLVRRG